MRKILLIFINIFYLIYLAFTTLAFVFCFHLFIAVYLVLRRGGVDDAYRIFDWSFGNFTVRASRFLLKVEKEGFETLPPGPVVAVYNHRTYVDIFFTALVPYPNTAIIVKDWPFRKLWGLNVFMRLAGYINVERLDTDEFLERVRGLAERRVSFQFFPEGRRSRDGSLGRFHTGAFKVALENNLPLVPVCMTGIERFQKNNFPFVSPTEVKIKILPVVYPGRFSGDTGGLEMCRHVENLFRKALEEC